MWPCETGEMRFPLVTALISSTAALSLVVGMSTTAAAGPTTPKRTQCLSPDPTWVADGKRVMQTLGSASDPGRIDETFFALEIAPEVTDPVGLNPGGYQRIWDMGVDWADVNPAPGVFDWSVLDVRVKQIADAGAKPLYVLGLTPQWAAANPAAGDPRWGVGTASRPADLETWRAYVRAVAERYNGNNGFGKIWAFETWNEANIATFWDNGGESDPDPFGMNTLGSMTKIAYDTIEAVNPDALLIAATTTTRVRGANGVFGGPQKRYWYYLEALKANGWPFDAWGIHSYPAGNAGPSQRMDDVVCWQEIVVRNIGESAVNAQVKDHRAGKPTLLGRPTFDTELNFGFAGPGTIPGSLYDAELSEALIWRAYIDSARLGIESTTWYLYSKDEYTIGGTPMGVQMRAGQASVVAYQRARDLLMRGSPFKGCGSISVPDGPEVRSCELAGYRDATIFEGGSILPSGFIIFPEDAFRMSTPTIEFSAGLVQPLVPAGSRISGRSQISSVGRAPLFVMDVSGLSR